jgi:hypothetical protein
MLEKRKVLDQIEVKSDGHIFMKELNQILDNGQIVSSIPHRSVFTPDMNIDDLPNVVKPYAQLSWTAEIKAAYEARKQESLIK